MCEPCLDLQTGQGSGTPGASAEDEAARRRERLRYEAEVIWGDEAAYDTHEDSWSSAFDRGAMGERHVGSALERIAAGAGVVLHDRAGSTNANIDHVLIVPSGIWVVDAKNHRGRVRPARRHLFGPVHGLRVAGVDRTHLVDGARWQQELVRSAADDPDVPVQLVLAFADDAAFSWFAKSFEVDGVLCCSPRQLGRRIGVQGPMGPDQVQGLARRLASRLPAK